MNRVTKKTYPDTTAVNYVYDTLNRLQTLTAPSAFGTGNFGFTYDALSRRTQLTRPNSVTTTYGYDDLSRLLNVTHKHSATTIDGTVYTVDAVGNRKTLQALPSNTTSTFTYDAIYQLTKSVQGATTKETYTYDVVGNRLSSLGVSPFAYNASNELTSKPGLTYTYDNNGNTLTKTDASGVTHYTWDFENRLTSVQLPGSGGTVNFKYDPFGRRIQKSSASATSVYAYDGDNLVEETNATGTVQARYQQGLNIDEPLTMLRSSVTSYYEQDGLDSTTSLSNSAGSAANTYTYDSFGNLTASTGSIINPFRYTSREWDTETGLYYYRARYYDPSTGRFLSEDPTEFGAGVDFYSYVSNRPVQLTDPMGLSAADVQRILAACKKCTDKLTSEGLRSPGSGRPNGYWNDLTYWFTKHESCYGQALLTQPCLANPVIPYEDAWIFEVTPIEWGTHRVVVGRDSNPSDPVVFCDPWRNTSWTTPKPPATPTGGGAGW